MTHGGRDVWPHLAVASADNATDAIAAMSSAVLTEGTVFTAGFDGVAVEMKGYLTMSEFNASSLSPYQTCAGGEDTLAQPRPVHQTLVQPTQAPVSMVSTGKPTEALIAASPKPTVPGHVVMPPCGAGRWCNRPRRLCRWCRRASPEALIAASPKPQFRARGDAALGGAQDVGSTDAGAGVDGVDGQADGSADVASRWRRCQATW